MKRSVLEALDLPVPSRCRYLGGRRTAHSCCASFAAQSRRTARGRASTAPARRPCGGPGHPRTTRPPPRAVQHVRAPATARPRCGGGLRAGLPHVWQRSLLASGRQDMLGGGPVDKGPVDLGLQQVVDPDPHDREWRGRRAAVRSFLPSQVLGGGDEDPARASPLPAGSAQERVGVALWRRGGSGRRTYIARRTSLRR